MNNLFFHSSEKRLNPDRGGMRLQTILTPGFNNPVPSLVLGSVGGSGHLVKGARGIIVDMENPPEMRGLQVNSGAVTVREFASNEEGKVYKRKMLVAPDGSEDVYVVVRTGFAGETLTQMEEHYLELLGKGIVMQKHGVFPIDLSSKEIESAELVGWGFSNRRVGDIPMSIWKMFRMPRDSELVLRDVHTPDPIRIVRASTKAPQIVDGNGYRQLFEDLENERAKAAAEDRRRRRA